MFLPRGSCRKRWVREDPRAAARRRAELFIVDVDVKDPVKRVEFWVEGKKFLCGRWPYRASSISANCRNASKSKRSAMTRPVTTSTRMRSRHEARHRWSENPADRDAGRHLALQAEHSESEEIRKSRGVFFARTKKFTSGKSHRTRSDVPKSRLGGVEYVRASVTDDTNYEASDLLYLNGNRTPRRSM